VEQPTCRYCGAVIIETLRGIRAVNRSTCGQKECRRQHHNVLNAAWRAENKEYHRAQIAEWRAANAERVHAKNREWREQNRERERAACKVWREANREAHRVMIREWERANPIARAGYHAQRRGWKSNDKISTRDWSRLVTRHGECCAYCGKAAPLTVDHVVPLSRGGRHTIGNVLPACLSCNSSKQDRLLVEWRAGKCHGRARTKSIRGQRSATKLPSGSKTMWSSQTVTTQASLFD